MGNDKKIVLEEKKAELAGMQQLILTVSTLIAALLFGFIGFLDDFIKVKKKQNEGLLAYQKFLLQLLRQFREQYAPLATRTRKYARKGECAFPSALR